MSGSTDHHDKSRDVYISHKLYLERRRANHYYNLGYILYEEMINDSTKATVDNLKDSIKNFEIALLFNQNDVDAKARKRDLCEKHSNKLTISVLNSIKNTARKEYKECTC
jgi:hypothetical protein